MEDTEVACDAKVAGFGVAVVLCMAASEAWKLEVRVHSY